MMRDYRLPVMTGRPVVVVKKTDISPELVENKEESAVKQTENIIHLSISDSVGLKESFG